MFIEKNNGKKHEFAREATCFDPWKTFCKKPTPRHFSFNTQIGACEECNGLGTSQNISWSALFPEPDKVFWEAMHGWVKVSFSRSKRFAHIIDAVFKRHKISPQSTVLNYPKSFRQVLLYGDKEEYEISFRVNRSSFEERTKWEGFESMINKWNNDAEWLRESGPCRSCNGSRLQNHSYLFRSMVKILLKIPLEVLSHRLTFERNTIVSGSDASSRTSPRGITSQATIF